MSNPKPATEPVPDLTVKQVAQVLYGDDGKTAIKRVQRLIQNEKLEATKVPGLTGPFLVKPASVRAFQQQQAKQDKKRRQSDTLD